MVHVVREFFPFLVALTAEAKRELKVLGEQRDALGVNRAQVSVTEDARDVRLGRLLDRLHRRRAETEGVLQIRGDLAHETAERGAGDEHLGGLLVPAHLTEGDGAGPPAALGLGREVAGALLLGGGAAGLVDAAAGHALGRALRDNGGLADTGHFFR